MLRRSASCLLILPACRRIRTATRLWLRTPAARLANYLAALTKFGAKTAMIGKVGNDAFGRLLIKTLKGTGI